MNEHFDVFAKHIGDRLELLSKYELFKIESTDLNASYLAAFPQGSNPVFRVRAEHDCACCRNFVKNFGGVFAAINGHRETVWCDAMGEPRLPEPYATVAKTMHALVLQQPIAGVFRTKQPEYGSKPNLDHKTANIRWTHLYGRVTTKHHTMKPDEIAGRLNTSAQVFERGLREFSETALNEVTGLIESNSLYRGQEFLPAVKEFAGLKAGYLAAKDAGLFVWQRLHSNAARFRSTVIGTLVEDLSNGVPLEDAVRMFESKVAPQNYKRPTALITPRMVDAALAKLTELGLEDAINRRFARVSDISVNDVLFVDNSVRERMRGGMDDLRASLMGAAAPMALGNMNNAQKIGIDDFLANVVPNSRNIEVYVKNAYRNNFVSLTAPAMNASGGRLFKWHNDFAWDYAGGFTDAIKQRVKLAGGNTNADLRVSLAWSNTDDLDLHAIVSYSRTNADHVYYYNKMGILDVDMNAGSTVRDPVENLSWIKPSDGYYKIFVNQFNKRNSSDVGFTLQVECNGVMQEYRYPKGMTNKQTVDCFSFKMRGGVMQDFRVIDGGISGGAMSADIWGIRTETFVPVTTMLTSPNYWEGAGSVGNKHWFFILKDCLNPDAIRGISNEYLRSELEPHRKVFEVLADKTRCPAVTNPADQLSGLGFSSTKREALTVKVTDANSTRLYEVNF